MKFWELLFQVLSACYFTCTRNGTVLSLFSCNFAILAAKWLYFTSTRELPTVKLCIYWNVCRHMPFVIITGIYCARGSVMEDIGCCVWAGRLRFSCWLCRADLLDRCSTLFQNLLLKQIYPILVQKSLILKLWLSEGIL